MKTKSKLSLIVGIFLKNKFFEVSKGIRTVLKGIGTIMINLIMVVLASVIVTIVLSPIIYGVGIGAHNLVQTYPLIFETCIKDGCKDPCTTYTEFVRYGGTVLFVLFLTLGFIGVLFWSIYVFVLQGIVAEFIEWIKDNWEKAIREAGEDNK